MRRDAPAEPWLSFLNDLDCQINDITALHCIGGFALVHAYGLERATADIDILSAVPRTSGIRMMEMAGKESPLRRKHKIYLDIVTIATAPEKYVKPACFPIFRLLETAALVRTRTA